MSKLIFIGLFLVVCSVFPLNAQSSSDQFQKNECTFEHPVRLTVKCGTLVVPEDRSDPAGKQVSIAVAVFKAQGDHPAPDPIFFLDGGPGASTLETWGVNFEDAFADFNQMHDVVLVDYRGAGDSQPSLYCNEVADYFTQVLNAQNVDKHSTDGYSTALENCHNRLVEDEHINLRMYRTDVIAQDITGLREALGYSEVDLMGGSYGTRLALTLLRDHPDGIRSVLLDGVYPPQVGRSAGSIVNINRAFEELFMTCAHAAACNTAFPDLRSTFYATANRLNKTPAVIQIKSPYNQDQKASEFPLTGDTFINYIFDALYSTWLIPSLPLIITQVADGNYTQMSQVVNGKLSEDKSISLGLFLTINCSEKSPFSSIKDAIDNAESVPILGQYYLRNMNSSDDTLDECALWGTGVPDPTDSEPVVSNVPVLIFNGEFDPITPPGWGELAAQTLSKSRVVTFPGIGHGASLSGSSCARQIAVAFFADPQAQLDISCINGTPIHWVTVDLSDSLAATETKLVATGNWTLDNHQSSIFWNSDRWIDKDDAGLLVTTDYLTTTFPQNVDKSWLDRLFSSWGKYKISQQCKSGSLILYEVTFVSPPSSQFAVRYWVDRTNPETIRDTILSLPQYSQTSIDVNSEKLFPQLPSC
jgi:pimeloyl-ACP methyl ester carboxylesterase